MVGLPSLSALFGGESLGIDLSTLSVPGYLIAMEKERKREREPGGGGDKSSTIYLSLEKEINVWLLSIIDKATLIWDGSN